MACCKDCTERVLGCHSTCERYINECEERERLKQMQKGYQHKDKWIKCPRSPLSKYSHKK